MPSLKLIFVALIFGLLPISLQASKAPTCKAFKDQPQAQRYFSNKKRGWKRLDGDKDGEACECLKGGSSYHKRVCVRWRKKHGKI